MERLWGRVLKGGPEKGALKDTVLGHGGVMSEKRRLAAWMWEETMEIRSQGEVQDTIDYI